MLASRTCASPLVPRAVGFLSRRQLPLRRPLMLSAGGGEGVPRRFAVLIDADNVPARLAGAILDEVAKRGVPVDKRVYGDWSYTPNKAWLEAAAKHGIETKMVNRSLAKKNASDISMVIDAMDLLHSPTATSNLDFVLVSDDADLAPLAQRLRRQGKEVIAVGSKYSALRSSASDSVVLEYTRSSGRRKSSAAVRSPTPKGLAASAPAESARTPAASPPIQQEAASAASESHAAQRAEDKRQYGSTIRTVRFLEDSVDTMMAQAEDISEQGQAYGLEEGMWVSMSQLANFIDRRRPGWRSEMIKAGKKSSFTELLSTPPFSTSVEISIHPIQGQPAHLNNTVRFISLTDEARSAVDARKRVMQEWEDKAVDIPDLQEAVQEAEENLLYTAEMTAEMNLLYMAELASLEQADAASLYYDWRSGN